jgi:hypothetical protein
MPVPMMLVVQVGVFVHHLFVLMVVLVALDGMEVCSYGHQCSGE